jgi:hypothetical protein
MADSHRFSLGQPRAAFAILAIANVSFAAFIVFGTGPWIPEGIILLAVNLAIATWSLRMALKEVRINDQGVLVVNAFATHRLPWSEIRRFKTAPPRRSSRLAGEPVVELNNGRTLRLTALVPYYKPSDANQDIDAALHTLNQQLARRHATDVTSTHPPA